MALLSLRTVALALCCGASAAAEIKCGDAKHYYRQSGCCGNPDKVFEVPDEKPGENATSATLAPADLFPGSAPLLMNFGDVCPVTPESPPTDGWFSLVPNASLVVWPNYADAPEDCQTACFAPDCFAEAPAHCCESPVQVPMLPYFSKTACLPIRIMGPPGEIYTTIAGACSADGELFYGEACGSMTWGPFKEDGLGPCEKPKGFCECQGIVKTRQPGCWRVESMPGPAVAYFKVHDPVCAPNTFEADSLGVPVGMDFLR